MSPSKKGWCRGFCWNITNYGPCYHHLIWARIMQNAECENPHSLYLMAVPMTVHHVEKCMNDLYWICDLYLSLFMLMQKSREHSSSFSKCSSNQGPTILKGLSRGWRVWYCHDELFMHSWECYFGVYLPCWFSNQERNTNIALCWMHN